MGKVKAGYSKEFKDKLEDCRVVVAWDVADDNEGYGVVIGDEYTDRTIAFGQGDLAYRLSGALFDAIINELDKAGPELPDEFEHDELETLYDSDKDKVLSDKSHFEELSKIVAYILKFK